MAKYQIGSIGDLISGKTSGAVETKTIVYRELAPKSQKSKQVDNSEQSADGEASPKKRVSFDTTTFLKHEPKAKDNLSRKRKGEFAGDHVSKPLKHITLTSSDESSEVKSQTDDIYSQNAARRVHIKNNTRKHVDDPERDSRTVFVGNIPYAHSNKKKLTKFFSSYGQVESVRIRCAPLKDPRVSKKVAVIKNEYHPLRSSISAFVVFKTPDNAKAALEANGTVFHDHHLRVDMAKGVKTDIDSKKSVFLGNVSFAAEEEDLWQMFAECGKIESVRIVRDPITAVSKGVAYVNFETSDAAELALHLDGNTLKKRNISVQRYRPSAKSTLTKPLTSKPPVRHKTLDDDARVKLSAKDEKRMAKKAKRKMRREGEKALGIVKKIKKVDAKEVEVPTKSESNNKSNGNEVKKNKHKFQGQTVEESKKKKKKINKGAIRKKKIALILSGEKKKKKTV